MTQSSEIAAGPTIDGLPWPEYIHPPPTDLPYDDGERMGSSWHVSSGPLLKACYVAAHGGHMTDFYVGVNMFVYFSWQQVRGSTPFNRGRRVQHLKKQGSSGILYGEACTSRRMEDQDEPNGTILP